MKMPSWNGFKLFPRAVKPGGVGYLPISPGAQGQKRTVSYVEIYETQPVIAAGINKRVRAFARTPLRLERDNKDGTCEPVHDHPLLDLLNKPAPGKRTAHLLQWIALSWLVNGGSVVAKFRQGGPNSPVTELLPLDWRYLIAYAEPGEFITSWVSSQLGVPYELDAEDVVLTSFEGLRSEHGYLNVSPLKQLGTTIRLDDAIREQQIATGENASQPSGLLVAPADKKIDLKEQDVIIKGVEALHKGPSNAGRVALLTGGLDWKATQQTSVEAELLAARQVNSQEACMVLDVSPTDIGDMTHATYSNVAEQNQDFYVNKMGWMYELAEAALQAQLVDSEPAWADDNLRIRFDPSEFLRGDPVAFSTMLQNEVQSGGLTLDERRVIQGRTPFGTPEAQEPIIMANNLQLMSDIAKDDGGVDLDDTTLKKIHALYGQIEAQQVAPELVTQTAALPGAGSQPADAAPKMGTPPAPSKVSKPVSQPDENG